MTTPVLVFDIETVPDVAGLRKLNGTAARDQPTQQVAAMAFQRRRQATGNDFLPLHLQRVVAISCALRDRDSLSRLVARRARRRRSAAHPALLRRHRKIHAAARLVERRRIRPAGAALPRPAPRRRARRATGTWARTTANSSGTTTSAATTRGTRPDGPARALPAARERAARRTSRSSCGFPGKLGMDGAQVWQAWQAGNIAEIRDYCETDVVNTYLVLSALSADARRISSDRYQQKSILSAPRSANPPNRTGSNSCSSGRSP